VFVGSLRKESLNRKLANALVEMAGPALKLEIVEIGQLPLFNQDMEANQPQANLDFKARVESFQAVLFLTPEYNRSVPGVLKNALDNASRPYGQSAWAGKPAGVLGASIGAVGTAVSQLHLRTILAYLDMPTMGQPEVYLHVKDGFFDEAGNIANAETKKFLHGWMDKYAMWVKKLTG
jgi:chromate reductase